MKFIIIVLLLSGCSVNSDVISTSEKLCEANGGVNYIYAGTDTVVYCKNGARFQL